MTVDHLYLLDIDSLKNDLIVLQDKVMLIVTSCNPFKSFKLEQLQDISFL